MRLHSCALMILALSAPGTALAFAEVGPGVYIATRDACVGSSSFDSPEAKAAYMRQAIEEAAEQSLPTTSPPIASGRWGGSSTLETRSDIPFRVGFWEPQGTSPFKLTSLDAKGAYAFLAAHRGALGSPSLSHVTLAESRAIGPYPPGRYFRFVQKVPGVECECEARFFVNERTWEVTHVESSLVEIPPGFRANPTLTSEDALSALEAIRPNLGLAPGMLDDPRLELLSDEHGDAHLTWTFAYIARCVSKRGSQKGLGTVPRRAAIDAHNGVFRGYVWHRTMDTPHIKSPLDSFD